MITFLDTNVLIYLTNEKDPYYKWATEQLCMCKEKGPAIISDIVYCEFSVAIQTKDEVDIIVSSFALERLPTTDAALFRAGKAFLQYKKKNKGIPKGRILPDFIIGAIAEEVEASLVTNNSDDYEYYFPTVKLITPKNGTP